MFHFSRKNSNTPQHNNAACNHFTAALRAKTLSFPVEKLNWLFSHDYSNWAGNKALPTLASFFGGSEFQTVNATSGRTRACHPALFSVLRGHLLATLNRGLNEPYRIHELAAGRTFEPLLGCNPNQKKEMLIGSPFPARYLAHQVRLHGLSASIKVEASDIHPLNTANLVCVTNKGNIYVGPWHPDLLDSAGYQLLRNDPQKHIELLNLYVFFDELRSEGLRSVQSSPSCNLAAEQDRFGLCYLSEVDLLNLKETLNSHNPHKYDFLYFCHLSGEYNSKLAEIKESIGPILKPNGLAFLDIDQNSNNYLIRNWGDQRISLSAIPSLAKASKS